MKEPVFTQPQPAPTMNDNEPHALGIIGSVDPIGVVGSVDPIGIVSDSTNVPGGQIFSMALTLSTALRSFSTADAYILPVLAGSAPAPIVSAEDVSVFFNNVAVHIHTTGTSATANPVLTHLVVPLVPNQIQQHIRLTAPIVTKSGQYIVTALGHNQNNVPTNGVSTTITIHP